LPTPYATTGVKHPLPACLTFLSTVLQAGFVERRPEDTARNAGNSRDVEGGASYSAVQAALGCSRATVAKIAKRIAKGHKITVQGVVKHRGGAGAHGC